MYKQTGWLEYDVKNGMRSVDIIFKGYLLTEFKDGQKIRLTFPSFRMSNIFMGNFIWQMIGQIECEDKENGLSCFIKVNSDNSKKQDFFEGEITKDGKRLCKITGSYMGHVDFDGVRYWDLRDEQNNPKHFKPF